MLIGGSIRFGDRGRWPHIYPFSSFSVRLYAAAQAKSLENKGPTGVNPWGAYVIFDGGEGSRTPVLNTVDAGVSMFRRR